MRTNNVWDDEEPRPAGDDIYISRPGLCQGCQPRLQVNIMRKLSMYLLLKIYFFSRLWNSVIEKPKFWRWATLRLDRENYQDIIESLQIHQSRVSNVQQILISLRGNKKDIMLHTPMLNYNHPKFNCHHQFFLCASLSDCMKLEKC